MRRDRVRALARRGATGRRTVEAALGQLDEAPVEDLAFAPVDQHRALRQGYPEVVFGQGKTAEQVVAICERLAAHGDGFLVTRASDACSRRSCAPCPAAEANALARTVLLRAPVRGARRSGALIVTAGTSDLPVAEEAVALPRWGMRCIA